MRRPQAKVRKRQGWGHSPTKSFQRDERKGKMKRSDYRVRQLMSILVVIMLLLCLAGCAPTAAPAPTDTSPPKEPTPAAVAATPEPTAEPAEKAEPTEEPTVPPEEKAETQWASKPFAYAGESFPNQIDPGMAVDFPGTQADHIVYETLYQYKFGTTELVPVLATDWEVSDDGMVHTFKLREGVTFHDGSQFDAEDVKFTYERIMKGELGMATFLTSFDHAEVVDDYTVKLFLKQPDFDFQWMVPMVRVVPTTIMEHEVDGDMGVQFLSADMVGTGPYMLERLEPPNDVFYTAYPDYWGGWDGPHFKDVVFRYGLEATTRVLQLEQGALDLISDVPVDEAERLGADPNITVVNGQVPRAAFYSINTEVGPTSDVRVRRALQLAFPYEQIPQVFGSYAYILRGAVPPGLADLDSTAFEPWEQDLDAARDLLAEAGYEPGDLSLTLAVMADYDLEVLPAQLLKEALSEIGVELEIVPVPWSTIVTAMAEQPTKYDMGALIITAKTPSARNYLHQLGHSKSAGGNWNWSHYKNPEFDKLLDEAAATQDPAARAEILDDAHRILVEDAVEIFEFGVGSYLGLRTTVKGYVYPLWSWARVVDVYNYWLEE